MRTLPGGLPARGHGDQNEISHETEVCGEKQVLTIIRNGLVITETGIVKTDILIEGEKIKRLGENISGEELAEYHIDATDRIVFPGIIDVHTHIQWGYLENRTVDNFASATAAAARGGITTIIDFALQNQGESPLEALSRRREEMDGKSLIDFSLHFMITDFSEISLKEIGKAISQGHPSFKLFMTHGSPQRIATAGNLAKVLECVGRENGIVGVHAEKHEIVLRETESLIIQGKVSIPFFPLSRPKIAEVEAIDETIRLAKRTATPLYIFHLTSRKGLEKITEARSEGTFVFAETCPHYLTFTQEIYSKEDGALFLINPPLREKQDIESLWRGLEEKEISVVSSDHCAFVRKQKEGGIPFTKAPAGVPSIELLFRLFYTEANKKGLSLPQIAHLLSTHPSKIFGLYPRKGHLRPGSDAD